MPAQSAVARSSRGTTSTLPYHVTPHHNPEGMIAPCPFHHQMADAGAYTSAQLRGLKRQQRDAERIECPWPWEPENIAFLLGGNILFGARPVLSVDAARVLAARKIALTVDQVSRVGFDLDLRTRNGIPVARIEDNVFEAFTTDLGDFRFAPGANVFGVEHTSGVKLGLRFRRYAPGAFLERARDVLNDGERGSQALDLAKTWSMDSEGKIPCVTITGTILTEKVTLAIRARELRMTMHFYGDEEASLKGRLFMPSGVLRICQGNDEVLGFG